MATNNTIVLGSINIDLVVQSARLPLPGETVIGGEFYRAMGGKGANQAVAAARSGSGGVTFIAAVGDDSFGREALEQLKRDHLNCRWVRKIEDEATGVALILVDASAENAISVASGANALLSPADVAAVDSALFRDARVFLACLESPLETVVAGLRRARKAGLLTVLNPAPASPEVASREILKLVDVLTPNEHEAAMLAGCSVATADDATLAARRLQELGAACVVVTRSAQGCVVADSDQAVELPARAVDAIDTTAAGDAFNGVLAGALADGQPLLEACRWAAAAATLSVTRRGAQRSLPPREEIRRFLAE